jgi:tRNA pseudouridine32 synthase/23S rRNA pseudouridine746 synthase
LARSKPTWIPPSRDGVGASAVALPPGPWTTVLEFLSWRLPAVSVEEWTARLEQGDVLDATGQPVPVDAGYRPQIRLWYWRELAHEAEIPFEAELLFQDDELVVVDKPHFLPMTPKGRYARHTLLARLKRQLGLEDLSPIHRLDRETAGVVVFSVRRDARAAYQGLFRERSVAKVYEAVAPFRPDLVWPVERHSRLEPGAHFMQVREVDGEPNASTRIELMAAMGTLAHYRLLPQTGQTHQLRVHMNALGLPLLGDRIYPVLLPDPPPQALPDYTQPLQLLARSIAFTDPLTGQAREFHSRRELAAVSAAKDQPDIFRQPG